MDQDDLEDGSQYQQDGEESEQPEDEQEVGEAARESKKKKRRGRPKIPNRWSRIISVDDKDLAPP